MIVLRDLAYRYPGAPRDALRGITLSVPSGSFVALMGSNGSGKSTLAFCLNGLLRPTVGEVQVEGRVGLVFQNPHAQMTSLTVEREIAFGLQNLQLEQTEIRARVDDELERTGFSERRHAPPRTLSAGEQQRLALSSVMVMRPSILVLDEATSLLSPVSRRGLLDDVRRERERSGMGVLLITQYPGEAAEAGRLVVLYDGSVALDGTPREILAEARGNSSLGIAVPP